MLSVQALASDLKDRLEQVFDTDDDGSVSRVLRGLDLDDVLMLGMAVSGLERLTPLARKLNYTQGSTSLLEDFNAKHERGIASLSSLIARGEELMQEDASLFSVMAHDAYARFEEALDELNRRMTSDG